MNENTEIIDGMIVDIETGEVLGLAEKPEFTVKDEDSANWVLGKMLALESDIVAIETSARVIEAKAILANAAAMKKDASKRLEWLHARFTAEIGEWARPQLEGKKTKTLKTLLGAISFRVKKGGLRVADKDKALDWAKSNTPNAIKVTEEFQISLLSDIGRALAEADSGNGAFEVIPDAESVTIKTGVSA
jgi:hypothetical protein